MVVASTLEDERYTKGQDFILASALQQGAYLGFLPKRDKHDEPSIYMLCRQNEEFANHLFVVCDFSKEVWGASLTLMHGARKWEWGSLSNAFKAWYENKDVSEYKAFPIAICRAIGHSRRRYSSSN
jgi:hypothetical protein